MTDEEMTEVFINKNELTVPDIMSEEEFLIGISYIIKVITGK